MGMFWVMSCAAELDRLLHDLQRDGHQPRVCVVDDTGIPGVAYLTETDTEAVLAITTAEEGRPVDRLMRTEWLTYPVQVVWQPPYVPEPAPRGLLPRLRALLSRYSMYGEIPCDVLDNLVDEYERPGRSD